tara:strand:+ start:945 stop:1769 length:825 start_codon:yes stop_codon:yes gene_type:complete
VKIKHNKKRNTAFLYEALVRELAQSVVHKNLEKKNFILKMLKEYFSKGKVLAKELSLYRTLSESDSLDLHVAEKIVCETRIAYHSLDGKKIYRDQSALIKKINSSLSKDAWNNFIPNYKSLATISHIFNKSTPVKQRVLYEEKVIRNLSDNPALEAEELETVDNIVYKKFVEKFNDKYKNLREEERKLLAKYISSFSDSGLELKIYLNEELGRLKELISKSVQLKEINSDDEMVKKTNKVLAMIEEFKTKTIDENLIRSVLKIQNLAKEIQKED